MGSCISKCCFITNNDDDNNNKNRGSSSSSSSADDKKQQSPCSPPIQEDKLVISEIPVIPLPLKTHQPIHHKSSSKPNSFLDSSLSSSSSSLSSRSTLSTSRKETTPSDAFFLEPCAKENLKKKKKHSPPEPHKRRAPSPPPRRHMRLSRDPEPERTLSHRTRLPFTSRRVPLQPVKGSRDLGNRGRRSPSPSFERKEMGSTCKAVTCSKKLRTEPLVHHIPYLRGLPLVSPPTPQRHSCLETTSPSLEIDNTHISLDCFIFL
ncbi:hypothetical protein AMTRI_Chr11g99430 [Amborella trichopoda]|uniref:Uncharacterized protein n=1 Tax=Amborella trichopoda TaxID=13333 RepID=W1PFI9_AMBTC|nr:hypothetical protein AMTR_s00017p00243290 [Amborella trichopoda]